MGGVKGKEASEDPIAFITERERAGRNGVRSVRDAVGGKERAILQSLVRDPMGKEQV
jgi:hypothetical protein